MERVSWDVHEHLEQDGKQLTTSFPSPSGHLAPVTTSDGTSMRTTRGVAPQQALVGAASSPAALPQRARNDGPLHDATPPANPCHLLYHIYG